jgi:pimeloyl-ACP methyl ester carboxylesterase
MADSMTKTISYVDGISYIDSAEVDLPAVVFLHGLGETKESFEKMIGQFKGKYRCIALDFRGHGDSIAEGPYTLAQASEDLHNVLEDLDIGCVSIIAGSYCCWVAQHFAVQYSAKVNRIVLLDGGYFEIDSLEGDFSQPSFQKERELDIHLSSHIKDLKMHGVELTKDVIPHIKRAHKVCFEKNENGVYVHKTPEGAFRGYLEDVASKNFLNEIASKVNVPVLLILADQSLLPEESQASNEIDLVEFRRAVKDLKITRIEKSDHLLMLSHPVESSLMALSFIQGQ